MLKRSSIFFCIIAVIISFSFVSSVQARPPKPGPKFFWVKPHTKPNGVFIPGHWKYKGPKRKGKVWVRGHFGRRGRWIPGHWK